LFPDTEVGSIWLCKMLEKSEVLKYEEGDAVDNNDSNSHNNIAVFNIKAE
jgi:hypothetical protein